MAEILSVVELRETMLSDDVPESMELDAVSEAVKLITTVTVVAVPVPLPPSPVGKEPASSIDTQVSQVGKTGNDEEEGMIVCSSSIFDVSCSNVLSPTASNSHFSGNDDSKESIVEETLVEGIINLSMETESESECEPVASSVLPPAIKKIKGRHTSEVIKLGQLGPREISVPFPSIAWDQPLPSKPKTRVIGGLVGPAKPTVMEKRLTAPSTKTLTKRAYESYLGRPLNDGDEHGERVFLGIRK